MMKRKVVAMATVAALLLFVGPTGSAGAAPPAPASAAHTIELPAAPTPEWSWAWGMDRNEGLAFGVAGVFVCAPFILIASVGCGIVGAL